MVKSNVGIVNAKAKTETIPSNPGGRFGLPRPAEMLPVVPGTVIETPADVGIAQRIGTPCRVKKGFERA